MTRELKRLLETNSWNMELAGSYELLTRKEPKEELPNTVLDVQGTMTAWSQNFTVILVTLVANQIQHTIRNLSKSQNVYFY